MSLLFDVTCPTPPGARPMGPPERCSACGQSRVPYGRGWAAALAIRLPVGGSDGDVATLCQQCTAVEIRARRERGMTVPPGYEWVA